MIEHCLPLNTSLSPQEPSFNFPPLTLSLPLLPFFLSTLLPEKNLWLRDGSFLYATCGFFLLIRVETQLCLLHSVVKLVVLKETTTDSEKLGEESFSNFISFCSSVDRNQAVSHCCQPHHRLVRSATVKQGSGGSRNSDLSPSDDFAKCLGFLAAVHQMTRPSDAGMIDPQGLLSSPPITKIPSGGVSTPNYWSSLVRFL